MNKSNKFNCLTCSQDYSTSICLPSLKIIYNESKDSTFPYADAIEHLYPILERILYYLPYNDLRNLSNIKNNNWKQIATNSLRKRHNLCWFYLKETDGQLTFERSSNMNYESISFLFLMYNYKNIKKLQMDVCIHCNEMQEKKTFMEFIEENIIEWDSMNCCILATDYLYPLFPQQNGNANSWFSAITIPEIENVRITATSCIPDSPKDDFYLDKNEKFICMLIFSIGNPHCVVKKFITDILNGYSSSDVALIGGVANRVMTDVCCNELYGYNSSFLCIGMIEYNSSSCKAYSIVLSKEEHFEDSVINFTESVAVRKNSILFRLVTSRDKSEEEDKILRKYFPNTAILGMETYGQCGWNKFPRNKNSINISDALFDGSFELSYRVNSTALMLITWED